MLETGVRKFFERYARFFNRSLAGDMDMDEVATLYASEFIASPESWPASRRCSAGYRAMSRRF